MQADYDGDGKTDTPSGDLSMHRGIPSGHWIVWRSLTQDWISIQWGAPPTFPFPGSITIKTTRRTSPSTEREPGMALSDQQHGIQRCSVREHFVPPGGDADPTGLAATDIPVAGNFNDGLASPPYPGSAALWRPSTGIWKSTTPGVIGGPYTRQWGLGSPPYLDFPVNGQKRVPYVSPNLARTHTNTTFGFESTAIAIPPNIANCGPDGRALFKRLTCGHSQSMAAIVLAVRHELRPESGSQLQLAGLINGSRR